MLSVRHAVRIPRDRGAALRLRTGDRDSTHVGRELRELGGPVVDERGGAHDERRQGAFRPNVRSIRAVLLSGPAPLTRERDEQRDELHGFAESHLVGENAAEPLVAQGAQPPVAVHLIRSEHVGEFRRHLVAFGVDGLELVHIRHERGLLDDALSGELAVEQERLHAGQRDRPRVEFGLVQVEIAGEPVERLQIRALQIDERAVLQTVETLTATVGGEQRADLVGRHFVGDRRDLHEIRLDRQADLHARRLRREHTVERGRGEHLALCAQRGKSLVEQGDDARGLVPAYAPGLRGVVHGEVRAHGIEHGALHPEVTPGTDLGPQSRREITAALGHDDHLARTVPCLRLAGDAPLVAVKIELGLACDGPQQHDLLRHVAGRQETAIEQTRQQRAREQGRIIEGDALPRDRVRTVRVRVRRGTHHGQQVGYRLQRLRTTHEPVSGGAHMQCLTSLPGEPRTARARGAAVPPHGRQHQPYAAFPRDRGRDRRRAGERIPVDAAVTADTRHRHDRRERGRPLPRPSAVKVSAPIRNVLDVHGGWRRHVPGIDHQTDVVAGDQVEYAHDLGFGQREMPPDVDGTEPAVPGVLKIHRPAQISRLREEVEHRACMGIEHAGGMRERELLAVFAISTEAHVVKQVVDGFEHVGDPAAHADAELHAPPAAQIGEDRRERHVAGMWRVPFRLAAPPLPGARGMSGTPVCVAVRCAGGDHGRAAFRLTLQLLLLVNALHGGEQTPGGAYRPSQSIPAERLRIGDERQHERGHMLADVVSARIGGTGAAAAGDIAGVRVEVHVDRVPAGRAGTAADPPGNRRKAGARVQFVDEVVHLAGARRCDRAGAHEHHGRGVRHQ